MYSDKYKLTFLHVPKNGGTSIKKILVKLGFKSYQDEFPELDYDRHPAYANHYPLWMLDDFKLPIYKALMVIRNPWVRMVSLYEHRKRKLHWTIDGKPRNTPEDIEAVEKGFKNWLLHTPSLGDSILTTQSQLSWGDFSNGATGLFRILRFEHLTYDWSSFCWETGFPYHKLPTLNKGNDVSYREYYDEESVAHVQANFGRDISRFGYAF